MPPVNYSQAR